MCKLIPGNQKHMTLDDRIIIQKALDASQSFRSIAIQLGKDPTTIAKEIKKHRTIKNIIPLTKLQINVPYLKNVQENTFVKSMLLSANVSARAVTNVTFTVLTLFLNPTIVPN